MMRFSFRRMCAVVGAGGVLLASVVIARPIFMWSDARLVDHFARRVHQVDDAAGAAYLHQLPLTSATAIRTLADAAASSRQGIALAAQTRLTDWILSVQRPAGEVDSSTDTSGRLLGVLAEALAGEIERLGPASIEWARRMGRHMLDHVELVPEPRRLDFIRHCDAVLGARRERLGRRSLAIGGGTQKPEENPAAPPLSVATTSERMMRLAIERGPLPFDSRSPEASLADFPEGGGAVGSATELESIAAREGGAENALRHLTGMEIEGAQAEGSASRGSQTATDSPLTWRASSEPPYARIAPQHQGRSERRRPETVDVPTPEATRAREEELLHAPLGTAIEALRSDDPFESAAAKAALRGRGMSPADLTYAHRLPTADPSTREQMLEQIARDPEANMTAWLRYFSDDASADVRLRALTLLATSRDQQVLDQVRSQAVRDEDPRIRALADRLP